MVSNRERSHNAECGATCEGARFAQAAQAARDDAFALTPRPFRPDRRRGGPRHVNITFDHLARRRARAGPLPERGRQPPVVAGLPGAVVAHLLQHRAHQVHESTALGFDDHARNDANVPRSLGARDRGSRHRSVGKGGFSNHASPCDRTERQHRGHVGQRGDLSLEEASALRDLVLGREILRRDTANGHRDERVAKLQAVVS